MNRLKEDKKYPKEVNKTIKNIIIKACAVTTTL